VSSMNLSSLSDGPITYTATATDAAGNTNTGSKTATKDTVTPTVTLDNVNGSPVTFPYLTNASVSSVGGTCSTGDGSVSVTKDGSATAPTSAACSGGSWTLTLTTAVSADGTYAFVASQTDAAGNAGGSGSNSV